MNKIILILTIFISFLSIGQTNIEYPRFDKDENGKEIILMTIEQAQKLDNNSDLLELYRELNIKSEQSDSIFIRVVNDKNDIIAKQDVLIADLKKLAYVRDEKIKNLLEQIDEYIAKTVLYEQTISNKDLEIKEYKRKVRKLKTRMIIGGGIGGIIITGLIFLLIL